jgi:hypothetical protein
MSKINEIKAQNPGMAFNLIDALNNILPKTKYVELVINLLKTDSNINEGRIEILQMLKDEYGFDYGEIKDIDYFEALFYLRFFGEYIGKDRFNTIKKFIDYNEKKIISKNDLTTYKSFEELEMQVSITELKSVDSELEKQVIKIYDSTDWLILKPMSWSASKKYGANTKWCTAMEYEPDHYYRYVKNGILIYCINKLSGDKFAAYRELSTNPELSFWNIKDDRIDSMQLDIPNNIMLIIKDELINNDITNWELLSDEDRLKQSEYLYENKEDYRGEIREPNGNIYRYQPRVNTNELNMTIRLNELSTQVQDTVQRISEDYFFRENTPQVRDEIASLLLNNGVERVQFNN